MFQFLHPIGRRGMTPGKFRKQFAQSFTREFQPLGLLGQSLLVVRSPTFSALLEGGEKLWAGRPVGEGIRIIL
jgi:hypothetical protein